MCLIDSTSLSVPILFGHWSWVIGREVITDYRRNSHACVGCVRREYGTVFHKSTGIAIEAADILLYPHLVITPLPK